MKKPRVLLADDHQIILHALKNLLESEFDVVGAVTSGVELIEKASELRPDILVVDVSMPLLGGIEAVRQLRQKLGDLKVVFLTMHSDIVFAARAFEAGAKGYVLKHAAPMELLMAVREAVGGRTFVSPAIAGRLMEYYRSEPQKKGQIPGFNTWPKANR
jgi:DNA-binding NarL/FixJ family response regulator